MNEAPKPPTKLQHPLRVLSLVAGGVLFLGLIGVFTWRVTAKSPDQWGVFESEHGFSYPVPWGRKFDYSYNSWEGDFRDGPIELWAVTRPCEDVPEPEFLAVSVGLSGIPAKDWKEVERGEGVKGWKWYRTYVAKTKDRVLVGGFGVGPRGSNILLLEVPEEIFKSHEASYLGWFSSVQLHADWSVHHSPALGCSLLVPQGMQLTAASDGPALQGQAGPNRLRVFATGAPDDRATCLALLRKQTGFQKWEAVYTLRSSQLWQEALYPEDNTGPPVFACIGGGAKGGVVAILETTDEALGRDTRQAYVTWARRVLVHR